MTNDPNLDPAYWSLARLADAQADIAATNKGDAPEVITTRWVEAIELLAVETHLIRKLMEADRADREGK